MVKVLIVAAAMMLSSSVLAEEQNVSPGINDHYHSNPDFDMWVGMFERPGREVYDKQPEIMAALRLQPGMAVADIGAGTGLYTRPFSQAVGPQGTVYAVDITKNFIDEIMLQARRARVTNVVGIVNSDKDAGLEADSIDLAFVCDTYHHFEYPKTMLRSIHQSLRPGGSLVIIDFRKIPGFSSDWVMSHTRADRPTVIREVESEGFELVEDLGFLKTNYYLRFKKL